jgi:membrane-associated phospholipid phosphatase
MAISYLTLDRPVAVQMHTVNETVEDWADQLGRIGRSAWKFIAPAIIAAFCWAIGRRRLARIWLLVPIALIVQGIAVNVLKFLIGRHRPGQLWEADDEYGFRPLSFEYEQHSFPSGHSSDIACLATLATIYMPKLWPLWWAVALLAGAGRVVSESHFISDVIGGLWVGMTITLLVVRYAQQRGWLEPPAQSPVADSAGGR